MQVEESEEGERDKPIQNLEKKVWHEHNFSEIFSLYIEV